MIRTIAAALALVAALTLSPVTAHEDTGRAPIIQHAGTADAAIRLPGGRIVQLEYAHLIFDRDCVWFEDGSARCE